MPKEKAPHGGGPIRGNDISSVSKKDSNVKIAGAIAALENELIGILHGTVTLTIFVRDGHLARYATSRERSYLFPESQQREGNDGV
jgi:hypothetical protein